MNTFVNIIGSIVGIFGAIYELIDNWEPRFPIFQTIAMYAYIFCIVAIVSLLGVGASGGIR